MTQEHETRLEQLRQSIQSETISYGELAELQSLAAFIDPSDVELLEAAGVPESKDDETRDESFDDASKKAMELLDQAAPLVAQALEVLMKAFGVGDAYAIERDIDYPPEKWRAATILVNARAAHMHITDYLGS